MNNRFQKSIFSNGCGQNKTVVNMPVSFSSIRPLPCFKTEIRTTDEHTREGKYQLSPVRLVEIYKDNNGKRLLGRKPFSDSTDILSIPPAPLFLIALV